MAKSFLDELTGYRVKVERDGKEVVNVPGLLALPCLLAAPKMSLIGIVAAPLLGCSIRVENNGKEVDVRKTVQETAESIVDTAKKTARTIEEEINKVWESVSADDFDGETETAEEPETVNEPETAEEPEAEEEPETDEEETGDIPTIRVKPDDSDQAE